MAGSQHRAWAGLHQRQGSCLVPARIQVATDPQGQAFLNDRNGKVQVHSSMERSGSHSVSLSSVMQGTRKPGRAVLIPCSTISRFNTNQVIYVFYLLIFINLVSPPL